MASDICHLSPQQLRDRRRTEPRQRVESAWYYAKKAIAIFPGVRHATAADFLQPYYRNWEAALTGSRIVFNRLALAAFRRWIPRRARQIALRYGLDAEWEADAIRRGRRSIFDPHELAIFRINEDAETDACLRRFEWARMHKILVPQYWQPDCRVAHKIDFYLHAMEHDLPIPTLRAVVENGRTTVLSTPVSDKLVCKPENGQGGRAVFILGLPPQAIGDPVALGALVAENPALQSGDWVVQDHVLVHPALADLAMRALPTVRLITMPDENGTPELLVTYLRIASDPDAVVDNFCAGGLMALIDPATGVMQHACIMRDLDDHQVHPATGQQIAGVQIPFWKETCELVHRAHATAFADYRIIGWDIAITESGPIIIEGNAKPCPQGAQQVQRHGLGGTRFGDLIAWHLADSTGR